MKERIIIIGGLSAGPSAAAKARRTNEQAEILLFEKTSHISYATCGIPYAMSGKIASRDKLMVVKPQLLEQRFGVEIHLNEPVIDIDPEQQTVYTPEGKYAYDKLIFATGGRAVVPPIDGLSSYKNWAHAKTIEDFDKVMSSGIMETAEHITIVGAGLIGLETAENLYHAGKKVTVIELGDQILAPWDKKFARMAEAVLQERGIDLRLGVSVSAIDAQTNTLTLSNGEQISTDYMLVGISVKPNTEMLTAKGAEQLGNGALIVNERMETSLPNIYAAGDCASIPNMVTGTPCWFPMGTHSNKGGRAAGANAAGGKATFEGGYGTAIMKLFDYTIARTGMNPKTLEKAGLPYASTFVIAGATPSFYPNQKDIYLEIYYHPETRQLYGAELFGEVGVDKRVDVLATAIYAKLTIDDLPKLDLAYAPPFSPAKDPVIVAGYTASNSLDNQYNEINAAEADCIFTANPAGDYTILDVRNPQEIEKNGTIENAINIPLDSLRDRLQELNKEQEIFVYCAKGLRGYLASLILQHNEFLQINNIAGGFTAWQKIIGKVVEMTPVH
ncbi:FAD-dependent oxidoreductase [Limibacter armeniacum]|uniref:FAD-dependent oxidoreductase n=1 Tax=Limibacter armeniacum TaxID=466084 RepID=UPI002FE66352